MSMIPKYLYAPMISKLCFHATMQLLALDGNRLGHLVLETDNLLLDVA